MKAAFASNAVVEKATSSCKMRFRIRGSYLGVSDRHGNERDASSYLELHFKDPVTPGLDIFFDLFGFLL